MTKRGLGTGEYGRVLALTAILLAGRATAQTTGSIAGRVIGGGAGGEGGGGNAKVYLHSSTTTFRLETTANPGGLYQFTGVPVGRYEVCATPVGPGFVDSCLWNRMGNAVEVTAAARAATSDIVVQKAAKLQVVFADAQSILESPAGRARPIQVHLWTAEFVALPVFEATRSLTARSYEIAVPVDVEVVLGIHGPPLRLSVGGAPYNTTEKGVHRTRVDSARETSKTVAVTVLGVAP